MSKCWYCNNELTTGDNPKHFGICNKCYDEMFKSGDTIIRSLTNKIAELKAENERLKEQLSTATMYHGCDILIAELQQQLKSQPAEIVEKIKKSIHYYPISLLDGDNEPRIKTLGISKEVLDNLLQEYKN